MRADRRRKRNTVPAFKFRTIRAKAKKRRKAERTKPPKLTRQTNRRKVRKAKRPKTKRRVNG